jgi:hypothetical protein
VISEEFHWEEKTVEKTLEGRESFPDRHGVIFCPNCSGSGKYFYREKGASVCRICEGFGLVRTGELALSRLLNKASTV